MGVNQEHVSIENKNVLNNFEGEMKSFQSLFSNTYKQSQACFVAPGNSSQLAIKTRYLILALMKMQWNLQITKCRGKSHDKVWL